MVMGLRTRKKVSMDMDKIPYAERLKMYQDFRQWVLALNPSGGKLLLSVTKSKIDQDSLVRTVAKDLVKMYVKVTKKTVRVEKYLLSLYYLSNYGEIEYRENMGAIPEINCRNSEMYRIFNKEFRMALHVLVGLRTDNQRVLYIKGVFPVQAII